MFTNITHAGLLVTSRKEYKTSCVYLCCISYLTLPLILSFLIFDYCVMIYILNMIKYFYLLFY